MCQAGWFHQAVDNVPSHTWECAIVYNLITELSHIFHAYVHKLNLLSIIYFFFCDREKSISTHMWLKIVGFFFFFVGFRITGSCLYCLSLFANTFGNVAICHLHKTLKSVSGLMVLILRNNNLRWWRKAKINFSLVSLFPSAFHSHLY